MNRVRRKAGVHYITQPSLRLETRVYVKSTANRESTAATQNLDMSRFWVAAVDFTTDLRRIASV
jgi:hypothetical protein